MPARRVDPQPGGDERVGPRVRRHALGVPVAVELPEHHLGRVERPEPGDDVLPGRLQVGRGQRRRRLHRHLGGELEQVGDDHVQHRAGGVVELGPVGDVERLRHVDLHRPHVLRAPQPVEHAVAEPQRVQVLGALLAEEVVDPEDLLLLEHLVHDPVQLPEALRRGAERLLVDHPGAGGQPVLAEALGDLAERDRWDRQVVQEAGVRTEVALAVLDDVEQAAGVVLLEPAAGEPEPARELLPRPVLRLRAELDQRVVHPSPEVLVRDVPAPVADEQPALRHQPVLCELEERR